jgi:hypothetical protein
MVDHFRPWTLQCRSYLPEINTAGAAAPRFNQDAPIGSGRRRCNLEFMHHYSRFVTTRGRGGPRENKRGVYVCTGSTLEAGRGCCMFLQGNHPTTAPSICTEKNNRPNQAEEWRLL